MDIAFTSALPEHTSAVTELLQEVTLPTDDLPEGLPAFLLAFDKATLVGAAGVEVYDTVGLLRSVAVRSAYQNQGIAAALVSRIIQQAQEAGVETLFLITTTANDYFARKGFRQVERSNVPQAIAKTQQFSGICPSSAIVMQKGIGGNLK